MCLSCRAAILGEYKKKREGIGYRGTTNSIFATASVNILQAVGTILEVHGDTDWTVEYDQRLYATTTHQNKLMADVLVRHKHCTTLVTFRQRHLSLACHDIWPPRAAAAAAGRRRTGRRRRVWNSFHVDLVVVEFAAAALRRRVSSVRTAAGHLAGRQTQSCGRTATAAVVDRHVRAVFAPLQRKLQRRLQLPNDRLSRGKHEQWS